MNDNSSIRNYIRKGSFYQAVVEDGADIIFIVDYEGNIHYNNPSAVHFLGYEDGELLGLNFIDLNHPSYQKDLRKEFERIIKEQYVDNIEFYFKKKDGNFTYLEFNSINLHHKDQIDALLLDCRDISQRKKDAEELVKAQKAKELFLANMSHEIRTPISGIAGMVTLLERFNRNTDERKYLNAIKHSAEHLKVIINDILDFAAIEAGKLTFDKIGFRPYDEVANVVDSFEFNIRQKGLEFDFEFSGDKSLIVKGDPVRLNQVLVNLINNAIKFTPKGKITLQMKFKADSARSLVSFSVKDTGIGIPEDKKNHLFESFSQADASINRRFGGTGLGLAISKHIVSILEGKIWFESEVDKGSTFFFEIPYEKGTSEDIVTKQLENQVESNILKGKKILLAEDNDINKLYTCKVLEDLGCVVEAVENGQLCVAALENNSFDLVLMDLQMPIMDGFQATQSIRNSLQKTKNKIPIIALTANAIKGDNEKCLEAGMNDYLSKPFTPDNLKKKLMQWIGNGISMEKREFKSLVNLDYLKEVCNNDERFIREMISTFLKSTPEMIKSIDSALQAKDLETVSKIAHKLKPSISFMGIESAQQAVIDIEKVKSAPTPEGYSEMVTNFLQVIKLALKELQEV